MNWDDKYYHTLNYELKKIFGEKAIKLSINGGFSCPNRDGKISSRGCIFCSEKGSGDFAGNADYSIHRQIEEQIELLSKKWNTNSYIAYFQSFTNTYAKTDVLRKKYYDALSYKNVKGLAIATRADCIDEDNIKLLSEINENSFLWVEIGLQTIHQKTADFVRRGYELDVFEKAINLLKKNNIRVVVHIILGLPGETKEDMLESIRYISRFGIWGVKLHLMHVIKNTDLEKYYEDVEFRLLEEEEYIDLVCDCLELLPEDIVIHRLTGDGKRSDLIGPMWSLKKHAVLNGIDKELKRRNSWQGKLFEM